MIKSLFKGLFFLTVASIIFTACGYDEVATDTVQGIKVESFDNSGQLPKRFSDNRCPKEAYMLWLSFRLRDNADVAHLASPIVSVRIVTMPNFDASHPAGSDVTELFMLHPIRPEISMSDYDSFTYEPVRFAMPSRQAPLGTVYSEGAYFMLMKAPAAEQQCQFSIDVTFDNGTTISSTADEVTLY